MNSDPAGLFDKLESEDPDVRAFAAYYLKNLGDYGAIAPLISHLDDVDSGVRRAAVHSISLLGYRFGEKKVVPRIVNMLHDPNSGVREEAAMGLGNWLAGLIDDPNVVAALIEVLKDRDREVAEWAALALESIYGREGGYDLARPLLEAESDADPEIGERVRAILAKKIRVENKD